MDNKRLKESIIIIAFILITVITLITNSYLLLRETPLAGVVVPLGAAGQQQAWTTFEAYDNYTGGTLKTSSGLTSIVMLNNSNSSLYISPADHRIVGKDKVYLLRYIRFGNVSNITADFNVTLSYSYGTDGQNFTNITSSNFAAGNTDKVLDMTLTAGKAPMVFSGNTMLKLDMKVSNNGTVYMEIFGSQ